MTPNHTRRPLLALTFLGVLALTVYQQMEIRRLRSGPSGPVPATQPAAAFQSAAEMSPDNSGAQRRRPATGRSDQARENHLDEVESELAEITKPLDEDKQDMVSSMFKAEVSESQSVVTGGHLTSDGKHLFTFITPKRVKLANGTEVVQIGIKSIATPPELAQQQGLESLATGARNTLQHAETWENQDVTSTLQKLRQFSTDILTCPSVTCAPGEKFNLSIGSELSVASTLDVISIDISPLSVGSEISAAGTLVDAKQRSELAPQSNGFEYSVAGTVDFSANGSGFIIKARVEQQDAPAAP
jgi:hypothetical protein